MPSSLHTKKRLNTLATPIPKHDKRFKSTLLSKNMIQNLILENTDQIGEKLFTVAKFSKSKS